MMKNYIIQIIQDQYLKYCIKSCKERIYELNYIKNKTSLSIEDTNKIKVFLSDKGKWIIGTLILLENIQDDEFYHKRQIYNLVNEYIRIESINSNDFYTKDDKKFEVEEGLLCYTNNKLNKKHILKKINKHLKYFIINKSKYRDYEVFDIKSAIEANKKYGFKMSEYLLDDIKLEEMYYLSNILSHNNTRVNKIIDEEKESNLYKCMFEASCEIFKQLEECFIHLKKELYKELYDEYKK